MSAQQTLDIRQKIALGLILLISIFLLYHTWFGYLLVMVGIMNIAYVLVTLSKLLWLIHKPKFYASLASAEFDTTKTGKSEETLPTYTILVPLSREANVLENLIQALKALDYPKDKLQILLLLEPDDHETADALKKFTLEDPFRLITIPDSYPKTKPKACNVGLAHATGEYLVIYDAEDQPEPDQLRKAVFAFRSISQISSGSPIACFQARLNFYNPRQNLLTCLFRLEYTFWFDLLLPALAARHAPIPLGGSSNHFRTEVLRELSGWDAYNVTEDCDIGIRLRRAGYEVGILDSTTYEEANSQIRNWLRQRSRWLKGYMQTYFVHMRNPLSLIKDMGLFHFWDFQVMIGAGPILCLLNPIFWGIFLWHLMTGSSFVESLFPGLIGYLGVFNLVFGNFLFIYLMMLAGLVREDYDLVKYGLLAPLTWAMMSLAAWMALWELTIKPHYWQKTLHGLTKTCTNSEIN